MPYPNDYVTSHLGNRLIYAELDYNIEDQKHQFQSNFNLITGNNNTLQISYITHSITLL